MAGSYNLGTAEGTIRINYDGKGTTQAQKGLADTATVGKQTGASLQQAGNQAGLAAGVLAAGFAYAAKKAVDFEHQISAIAAVSGATKVELDEMRKKALQLGADTVFSASQAASAMEELAKAGISTTDILNGAADATVALAAAGGIDLATAATIAANAMNQFGLKAQQLPKIVDSIAGAANSSAIDVHQLGLAMQQVGAVAHLAGLSFNDTAVAIAEMGNAGIKGSDAGTSLKTFLQNLIPTTKKQIELSKELGLITKNGSNAFFDQNGNIKSLSQISEVLKTSLKGLTKEQQLNTLGILFGSDAIRAAAVLADNGAAGFDKLAVAIGKTTAADVAAKRLDNAAGQLEQLKGSAETAAIAFGTLLLPILVKVARGLTSFANSLNSLSSGQKNAILIILAVATGLLTLVFVVTKIIAVVNAFKAVWIALNTTFLFSPIGLIIILVVALIAAFVILWMKSAAFRNFWIGLWGHIWSFLKMIGAWFAGPFANFFIGAWHAILVAANAVWSFLKMIGAWFAGPFANFFVSAWNVITNVFNAIRDGIIIALTFVIGFVRFWVTVFVLAFTQARDFVALVFTYINAIIRAVVADISARVAAFAAFWVAVWNVITGFVAAAVNRVIAIVNAIGAIVGRIRAFFSAARDAAAERLSALVALVLGIPGRILSALGNLGSMLYDAGKRIIQGLINGILDMVGKVKNAVSSVLSSARNLLPWSPAKEGPFSGRGWTLYSGRSLTDAFAEGITDHADNAVKATLKMVGDVDATIANASPLQAQFNATGGAAGTASPAILLPAPAVNVRPQVTVIADLGDGVREVVKSTIVDNPDMVSSSSTKGSQKRKWLSPGRADG
jgi:TP901 family phage tail tape measure protein